MARRKSKKQLAPVSVRMPREIKQTLEGYAKRSERSLHGLMLFILREWVTFQNKQVGK